MYPGTSKRLRLVHCVNVPNGQPIIGDLLLVATASSSILFGWLDRASSKAEEGGLGRAARTVSDYFSNT